ncbi:MAG: fibronectin type III domain-containing protein [bacterium]
MKKNGFALLDVVIIVVLILIVSAFVYTFVLSRKKSNKRYAELSEMQRNIRAAMEIICNEFQMVEYKVREQGFKCNLARWINADHVSGKADPLYSTLNNNFIITLNPNNRPDIITFFRPTGGSFRLSPKNSEEYFGAEKKDTKIALDIPADKLKEKIKIGDTIRIGNGCGFAQVKEISGKKLTIDTDPTVPENQGLADNYPANEKVTKIDVITYALFNEDNDSSFAYHDEGHPRLVRRINNEHYVSVQDDIIDFQIKPIDETQYTIQLTAQTKTGEKPQVFSLDSTVIIGKERERIITAAPDRDLMTSCPLPARCKNFEAFSEDKSGLEKIHLRWDPVTTDTDGNPLGNDCVVINHIIYYGTELGNYSFHYETGTETDVILSPKGMSSCSFYVSVAAQNNEGIGIRARPILVEANKNFIPDAPQGLKGVIGKDKSSVDLTWKHNADNGIKSYNIYRLASERKDFKRISAIDVTDGPDFSPSYHDANFYDLPVLCRAYFYKITAVGCSEESDFSNVISVYLEDAIAPQAPSEFFASNQGGTVKLSWEKSPDDGAGAHDVEGYNIYAYDVSGPKKIGFVASGYTSYVRDHTFDHYGICAVDKCGNQSPIVENIGGQ